jgi:hypothetical protein
MGFCQIFNVVFLDYIFYQNVYETPYNTPGKIAVFFSANFRYWQHLKLRHNLLVPFPS